MMREAGRVAAEVLEDLKEEIKPGITTAYLDKLAEAMIRKAGGEPVFKGYHNYPASICTSVNYEVVHGIPGLRRLQEGDIISIDLGVRLKGYCSDLAATFAVGEIGPYARELIEVTRQSLQEGIAAMQPKGRLTDISHAVYSYVKRNGFSVVRSYAGHGIGTRMHEDPQVPNYGPPGQGPLLLEGMTLAIEPMITLGGWHVRMMEDGWTMTTMDGSPCAHYEHTVAVLEDRAEILTLPGHTIMA